MTAFWFRLSGRGNLEEIDIKRNKRLEQSRQENITQYFLFVGPGEHSNIFVILAHAKGVLAKYLSFISQIFAKDFGK